MTRGEVGTRPLLVEIIKSDIVSKKNLKIRPAYTASKALDFEYTNNILRLLNLLISFCYAFFVQGRRQPTQSQLIQIYIADWTDFYDTHNIEHRTAPVSH